MATNYNYGMPLQGSSPNKVNGDTVVAGGYLTPTLNIGGADGNGNSAAQEAGSRAYGVDVYDEVRFHKTDKHPTLSLIGAGAEKQDHYEFICSET